MPVSPVNKDDFEKEVLQSNTPVMVDFWAEWCGPCKMLAPTLEKLSEKYSGNLKIVKLNVDENQELAIQYKVMSIPTLLFFKDGKEVDRIVGAAPENTISKKIDNLLAQR